MKIESIQTQVKHIALKTPFITALRRVEAIEFVRVCVVCDNGVSASGEAPSTMAITGENIEIILDSISKIKDNIYGLNIEDALRLLHNSKIGSSAKAALDMALVSLRAKEQNKTLLEYFNIKDITPIKTDITISLNQEEIMLEDAQRAFKSGMDILKIKLGPDISHAINVTQRVSINLPNVKLLIDANQAWSRDATLHYINAIKDLRVELIEQPVVANDLEGLKLITNATKTSILADEASFTLEDVVRVVESNSADMINIKLMKCGGVSKAVEILEYAREKEVKCMLGSMLEGPYSINAALYLAFAYRDVIEYVDLDSPLLYKEESVELDFSFDKATIFYLGPRAS